MIWRTHESPNKQMIHDLRERKQRVGRRKAVINIRGKFHGFKKDLILQVKSTY